MKGISTDRLVLGLLTAAYSVWAAAFIFQNSYIALDGQRYFGLFDDAMISMRYAWNLAHGLGLVWNMGERIEGYSNLLMTLIMAVPSLVLTKTLAVLAVQILGIPTMLGVAWLARHLARILAKGHDLSGLVGALMFAGVLLYFPISYWTLLGMETGLLSMLILSAAAFALRWLESARRKDLIGMAVASGLACLTRNDSFLLVAVLFGFVTWISRRSSADRSALRSIAGAAAIVGIFVVGQLGFRLAYYGQLVPNTYILKLTNYPLSIRL
ncbi:MAG TPA: hypothetical protein VFH29_03335, partial [Anaerolineales bacterium]|nr:hypothetical protein [Anaerolineales bacterium]